LGEIGEGTSERARTEKRSNPIIKRLKKKQREKRKKERGGGAGGGKPNAL